MTRFQEFNALSHFFHLNLCVRDVNASRILCLPSVFLLSFCLIDRILPKGGSLILSRQTHHAAAAPFTSSHRTSAIFNIFRAVALAETRGRERETERKKKKKHCCYGNEERVNGSRGARWQKTRPDLTMPAPIGPERNADVFWHHDTLEAFSQGLVPETLRSHYVCQRVERRTPTECRWHLHS